MSDSAVTRIQNWLRAHEAELLQETREIIRIPSVEGEPAPNAPFGQPCRDALDRVLHLASGWGMRTKDLEGFIGYAETGQGERLILVLGHLDVVPVGAGWHYEPFGAEIADDYLYGRGTTDDKGPAMAALFAVRAITECFPELNARIRVAFGCNEESGFKCVQRYVKTEEAPTFGVAPDAMWPLCQAEKGISNITLRATVPNGEFSLVRLEGGQRPNIVMDRCEAEVHVAPSIRETVNARLADKWDRNIDVAWDNEVLKITAIGKAAHGATPFEGDSAASRLFRFLVEICPTEAAGWFATLLDMCQNNGAGLGIAGVDEVSRDLTSNIGIAGLDDGHLKLLFNVRYPVTWKGSDLRAKLDKQINDLGKGWEVVGFTDSPSLYFPLDHPLVKTICEVVKEETGDDSKPGVMGGGTYARAVPNTVAIGTSWSGDGKAHETDERIKIDSLYRASRIYANILYRLATL
jgi:succinyl-diaminopimelate desuccinylase